MITRVSPSGEVLQALFPVGGHAVAISPDASVGFFGALELGNHVAFDPETLDLIATGEIPEENWIGGGHGVFYADGQILLATERAPLIGYLGGREKHHGRLTLRDPKTLRIIESYSSHGISPHDIRLLADGRHAAIAHYGSTYPPGGHKYGLPRHIVEPSAVIVDLANGSLIDKIETGSRDLELRHLCQSDAATLIAIQVRTSEQADELLHRLDEKVAYEIELSADDVAHLPAAVLLVRRSKREIVELGTPEAQVLMRHGLSIAYDEQNAEVIATFPGSHHVMVFDASTGEIRRKIDCAVMGLEHPSGLAIVQGSDHYFVTGYWKNLYAFRRGTHELLRDLCTYTTFFGHGHIAVA
jgi:hypothetical protein